VIGPSNDGSRSGADRFIARRFARARDLGPAAAADRRPEDALNAAPAAFCSQACSALLAGSSDAKAAKKNSMNLCGRTARPANWRQDALSAATEKVLQFREPAGVLGSSHCWKAITANPPLKISDDG
jgi:hypothetical protein